MGSLKIRSRSVFDYSSFINFAINNENANKIQVIQNKCLRHIFNARYDWESDHNVSTDELHKMGTIQTVKERANSMLIRYLTKAVVSENQLIIEAINDHNNDNSCNFCNNKIVKKLNIKSIFCNK